MKFSSRAIYGMRAMLALARAHGHGSTFLKEIVEREGLPGTYLEQLMVPLRKAGIVQGVRGARGGYTLSRSPAEIPVLRIDGWLASPGDGSSMTATMRSRVGSHTGDLFLLASPGENEVAQAATAAYGLRIVEAECQVVTTNLGGPYEFCPLRKNRG